jgi:hypothetical protein
VKLTTHLQLVPRSRKCGFIHPLSHDLLEWWLIGWAHGQVHILPNKAIVLLNKGTNKGVANLKSLQFRKNLKLQKTTGDKYD